ncbi:unnamed protein product [Adineta ricciae]|uniref:Uncharacterized protein n=1 Tax=Adineta ricciae TaxID=249248 RepID=A0A813UMZ7_ADIRI|nr:unnamed protein product [Adineta ricciae]CAF1200180.1 unnamed protein product [Adineta ricciae]
MTITAHSSSHRRLHNQSHLSNANSNPNVSLGDSSNLSDSFSVSSLTMIPLVTITYCNPLLSQDNQQLLVNSYATCRRLLDHMKSNIGIPSNEAIDLIDHEGKLKELSTHLDEYATQFLTARSTYYILKVEIDTTTGEKRYTPNFSLDQLDQRLCIVLTNTLNALNKSSSKPKRISGTVRQYITSLPTTATNQSKTKRTPNRK